LRRSQLDEVLNDARRYNWSTSILLTGDFNLDMSGNACCYLQSAALNFTTHLRTSMRQQHLVHFLEHGRIIDWIFTRGPVRAGQPQVHRSVSASDHYPLSMNLAFV